MKNLGSTNENILSQRKIGVNLLNPLEYSKSKVNQGLTHHPKFSYNIVDKSEKDKNKTNSRT